MHTKKDASFIITVALSMLILAFWTFITVYEQILSQSNGFFNVIIFGVVLVLVFIFITLLARIIVIKTDNNETSPVLRVLEILGILAIFVLFAIMRLKYTSSISTSESFVYKAADYLVSGQLPQGADVHPHLFDYPADFIYAFILSNIFSVTGISVGTFILNNVILLLVLAFFLFLTVSMISNKACASVAVLVMLFMPNHSFLVYSFNSELFVACMFMISFYLYERLIYRRFKKPMMGVLMAIVCGIFSGITISSEPVIILAYIALTVWMFKSARQLLAARILPIIVSIVTLLLNALLKVLLMGASFSEVIMGYLSCFVPVHVREDVAEALTAKTFFTSIIARLNNPSRFLEDNFYFLTDETGKSFSANQAIWLKLTDQLVLIFMFVLCVLCIVYILRVNYDKILPALSAFIMLFIGQFLSGVNQVNYLYIVVMVIIIGSTTINYMYLNHHSEYAVYVTNQEIKRDNEIRMIQEGLEPEEESEEENTDDTAEEVTDEYIQRAKALIFVGENEELYKQIKESERIERMNNPIAVTRIKTTMTDEGEYDSVEEKLEFFDELDTKTESVVVHEVKAIPETRPVEVVKPVLADEYNRPEEVTTNASFEKVSVPVEKPIVPVTPVVPKDPVVPKAPVMPTVSVMPTTPKAPVAPVEGFVFRNKSNKKPSEVKPGEPLPNPLPTPKKHVAKELDFDLDVNTKDDFDY